MRRLIESIDGADVYHHYDHDTQITRIETVQNVEPILQRNKELAKTDCQAQGIKNDWWFVGTIPNGVIALWKQEGIDFFNKDHWPAIKKKLNDPDWRYLRTGRGRV